MSTSPFDYDDAQTSQGSNTSDLVWNILTVVVLLAAVAIALIFLILFVNPQSALNPLPPPTLPTLIQEETLTPTPRNILPPTWTPTTTITPTFTQPPTITSTQAPSLTPTFTFTPDYTNTGTPEADQRSFQLQEGSPEYTENFAHEDAGCQWFGVAGHVFDLVGDPITEPILRVRVGGTLGGETISEETMLGMESGEPYGPGGYEIVLGDQPIASTDSLWIQLISPTEDLPLSEQFYFDTFDTCDSNLILIEFIQVE
jgi:hypothetical protein